MEKWVLGILVLCLWSGMSLAGPAGTKAAYQLCRQLSMDSEIDSCAQIVSASCTIDDDAIGICARGTIDNDIVTCIQAIASRTYDADNVKACGTRTIWSDIESCLSSFGTYIGSASTGCCPAPAAR
jgi:hypothetical protein